MRWIGSSGWETLRMRTATETTTKWDRERVLQRQRRRRRKMRRGRTRGQQRPRQQRKNKKNPPPLLLGDSIGPPPWAYLVMIRVQRCWIGQFHVLQMLCLHRSQSPMAGQRRRGTRVAGRDNKSYYDLLDLDGYYFFYVCVRDTRRAGEMEDRNETDWRRK